MQLRKDREKKKKRKKRKGKKQRFEEARLQHKQAEDKLQAWREDSRCAPEEGRAHHREDLNENTEKLDKEHEAEDSEKAVNDLVAVGSDIREADDGRSTLNDDEMSTESAIKKVGAVDVAESSTPNADQNNKPTHGTCAPQSYDISPYQCSDDEEDEVDRIPTRSLCLHGPVKAVYHWLYRLCNTLIQIGLFLLEVFVAWKKFFCPEDYNRNRRESPCLYENRVGIGFAFGLRADF